MRKTVLHNLRCQWKPLALSLAGAAGLTAFLCLCCIFCAPVDAIGETVAVCFGPFAAASWLLIAIGLSLNFYPQSAFLYLLLGTTRRGVFLVRVLADLCFAAAGGLVAAVGVLLAGLWNAGMAGAPVALFGGLFFAAQLTELCGLLSYRYGKWGMLFYAFGILVLCSFSGFFVGMVAGEDWGGALDQLLRWMAALPLVSIGGLLLVCGGVVAALCWGFFRRAAVKA